MPTIEFSREEKELIGRKIQLYFSDELDQEIGQFDAEFLLDFFAREIGPFFYNRGLYDARAVMETKLVDIGEALYEIEKRKLLQTTSHTAPTRLLWKVLDLRLRKKVDSITKLTTRF
jgi:uncharacterized protein (DUF2164 family)